MIGVLSQLLKSSGIKNPSMLLYFEPSVLIRRVSDLKSCETGHCLETSGTQRGFGNEVVSMAPTLPQLRNRG